MSSEKTTLQNPSIEGRIVEQYLYRVHTVTASRRLGQVGQGPSSLHTQAQLSLSHCRYAEGFQSKTTMMNSYGRRAELGGRRP